MKDMIGSVVEEICAALAGEGATAVAAYTGASMKNYAVPVFAVGMAGTSAGTIGMCSYLGEQENAERGTICEIYGKRMKMHIAMDIYAPRTGGQAVCAQQYEILQRAMLQKLPRGLRTEEISSGEIGFDSATGMFRQRCTATMEAYFTAQSDESGLLLDFELKGVMKK